MRKKTYKFAVGDRVGEFTSEIYEDEYSDAETVDLVYDSDNPPEFGEVLEVLSDTQVKVKWDCDWRENISVVEASSIAPEKVVAERLSVLEKEFKVVEKEVAAKLKEVAKGLRDANKLAQKKLGRNLYQLGMGYGPLYNAMDASGWRTSSFGC